MLEIRRAIYWQLAGLAIAVALVSMLSGFFPVVDFVEALQERVMRWGALGAICYPLLFAVCNILLLPGGVLAVGGGFFFGLWWGFLVVFAAFRTYMIWASLGRVPGLFLYAYVGTLGQLGLRIIRGKSEPRMIEYWTWGGAFLTTALLLLVLGRIASRAVHAGHENEKPAASENEKSQGKESVEHRAIL